MNGTSTMLHAAAGHLQFVITAVAAHASSHGHKGSRFAVIVSFVGLIAIIVLIVVLGSTSVRRRVRDKPPDEEPRIRRPRQPGRGLFG
jgi:Na+/melibiose symporter-like transporter